MDQDFAPIIWAEDEQPPTANHYNECEVCTGRSRIIWGEGNPQAPIMIILDNPGEREDKEGREYVCGTRQTLQMGIHQVNLTPKDVYLTYLLKCRPTRRYDKEKARSFSKPFLNGQIEKMKPKFIICLGDVVVQSMFNNSEANVRTLRGRWHHINHIPVIVSYHPLAVRRRPNLVNIYLDDWKMLAEGFHGK